MLICHASYAILFPCPSPPSFLSVHDDVQLCQWLRKPNGQLTLGDFNRAEIMFYDREEEEYCKYYNGLGYGDVSTV